MTTTDTSRDGFERDAHRAVGGADAGAPRYVIEELVASGGMADVHRGHDRVLRRKVAIKRLRGAAADASARERFTREAHALAGFSHPHAVAVYDTYDDADGPIIVMEYVDGQTLRARLRAEGRLGVEPAAAIGIQLLDVLAAAHAGGIVHRDIKPGNVLLTGDGLVKLADFGIATMHDAADLTHTGEVVGTPRYLSPEQAVGRRATPRSDLYAVGVLLYEMACGRAPFEGDTPAATMTAHRSAPVPALAERCAGVPDWYVAVVERALAKDPDQRYPDAAGMRAALEAGLRGAVTVVDSTLDLPVLVAPADAPTIGGTRRPGALWPTVLFVVAGLLVAVGVWAFGDPDGPTRRPPPTDEVPTFPSTLTQPPPTGVPSTVAPLVVPGGIRGGGVVADDDDDDDADDARDEAAEKAREQQANAAEKARAKREKAPKPERGRPDD